MSEAGLVVIGAGFTGLAAAYELARAGRKVVVLESDAAVGGLAGSFAVGGTQLERFYHHWFNSDRHVMELIDELGCADQVVLRPTNTGMYFANALYRLASPLDVLKFSPLSPIDRVRLGLLVLKARRQRDWRALDRISAADWLRRLGGEKVYRIVWEPLLLGKFGAAAESVSAAWFWSKLILRGGSRGKHGEEVLAYYRGGFAALAARLADAVRAAGGDIRLGVPATGLAAAQGRVVGVETAAGTIPADQVLATAALPIVADLGEGTLPAAYVRRLREIRYLANVCLVLQLDRSLSGLYWINVNNPSFPFVGIIEHTNFEGPATYGGRHIVYLSKYLVPGDRLYAMGDRELLDFAIPHIREMFPAFDRSWVLDYSVWRAEHAQPLVTVGYAGLIPEHRTPLDGLFIASMAQIYPEDRGTNHAIREGREAARLMMRASRDAGEGARLAPRSGAEQVGNAFPEEATLHRVAEAP